MEKIIICNLKSNLENEDIKKYIEKVKNINNLVVIPSSLYLKDFIKENIKVGIQDISPYEDGPYTSFISAKQASSINVSYVLLNHVEIKKLTNQTKEDLIKKINLSKKYNLKIILCIENIEELNEYLNINLENIDIVLEPGYTIGSKSLTIEEIEQKISKIKEILNMNNLNNKVLYGGSVNLDNIKQILSINVVDGVLLGKSSLNIDELLREVN